nr:MAG TPA: hypothetical protein [Bacteriophage sp.]
MEKYIRYETPGNVSIISEQKKHPATCKIYSQNQHYKHTRKVVNTRPGNLLQIPPKTGTSKQ